MYFPKKQTIAHLVRDYLNPTENWIHSQITPGTRFDSLVLTKNLKNSSLFPARIFKYRLLSDYVHATNFPKLILRKWLAFIERFRNLGDTAELGFYIRTIKENHVSLIHAHYGPTGYLAIPLKLATQLPLVVSFYGQDVNSLPHVQPSWRWRYQKLFAIADAVIVKGPHMKQKILDLGCPAKKVHLIDAGIEVDKIKFSPRLPTKNPKLLTASRLVPFKGIKYAIQAMPPKTTLTIIGSGPEKPALIRLTHHLRLSRRIKFMPFMPLHKLLATSYKHDIFLCPSITTNKHEQEGIPTSLVQHLATGMPAIATNHSDIPTVIKHNHTGLLVPEKDTRALSQAIIHLIQKPRLWSQFAHNGRKLVEREFNASTQTKKRERLYARLVLRSRS